MPVKDGEYLVREVRAQDAKSGARTPALAMTAFSGAYQCDRAVGAGFDDYLIKPFDVDALAGKIRALVPESDGTPQAQQRRQH